MLAIDLLRWGVTIERQDDYGKRQILVFIRGAPAVTSKWKSEEVWRNAVTIAWSQMRQMEMGVHSARQIEREKRRYERIRAGGLPEWQERGEWAGFKFPKLR